MRREELVKLLAEKQTEADKMVDDFIPLLFKHVVKVVSSIDTSVSIDSKEIPKHISRTLLLKKLSDLGYSAKFDSGGDQRDSCDYLVISWGGSNGRYHDNR